eukprot:TRINITY_DN16314_c0_g1_i1.p1 TRINITY_DN16314_c0_g1~~TRINITY_DN16314_c0_g1_i1.p1  ORF type:complete len:296 (-),score=84.73 TRINITY_DN16314_c0_g1_i1:278-1165(-)
MIRRPPRSTLSSSSAASDVYKRQVSTQSTGIRQRVMGICDSSDAKDRFPSERPATAQEEEAAAQMAINEREEIERISASELIVVNLRVIDSFVYTNTDGEDIYKEDLKEEFETKVRALSRVRDLKRSVASRWSIGTSMEDAVLLRFQLCGPDGALVTLENDWEWSGAQCQAAGMASGCVVEVDGARELEKIKGSPDTARHKKKAEKGQELTEEQKRSMFEHHDMDRSGTISVGEFAHVLRDIFPERQGTTNKDVQQYVSDLDEDNDGEISYAEFCKALDGFATAVDSSCASAGLP